MRLRPLAILTGLTAIFGSAVFWYGGVVPQHWNFCLLALGLMGLLAWLIPHTPAVPALERRIWIPMILFSCYVGLQIIPLPWALLRVLSPERAAMLRALEPIFPRVWFGSLSVNPSATFGHFTRIAGYTIVFLLVREAMWRLHDHPWLVAVPIVVIGGLEAILGVLQYLASPASSYARGTYINRNHFAGLLEMALPFAVMYSIQLFHRERPRGAQTIAAALGMAASALAMLFGILFSLSRMGFAACVCSLLIVGILALRTGWVANASRWATVSAAVAVVTFFVTVPPSRLLARFNDLLTGEELSSTTRLQLWTETLGLIEAYPVVGCGLGAYQFAFPKYQRSVLFFTGDFAHNDYLQGLAELGLVGFAIVSFLLFEILALAIRASAIEARPDIRALAIASTGAIVAILIHSCSDFNLYIPSNALLLAWIAGIATALPLSAGRRAIISMRGHTVIELKPVIVE